MKKKLILTSLLALTVILGVIYILNSKNQSISVSNPNYKSTAKPKTESTKTLNVKVNPDLIKSYNNIKDLKKDSEIIVKGTVLETNSYVSIPSVITEYKFKVEKSYNNNAKTGDILTLASAGGIVDYEDYISINENNKKDFEKDLSPEKLKNTKIKVTMGDNDLIEKGLDYIIFASTQNISDNKKMYCTLNIYQGQFNLHTSNNTLENKSLNYNKTLNEFEKELQNISLN